jgi:cyclophilin family peptidyl-prolyl cis-trans isomerase
LNLFDDVAPITAQKFRELASSMHGFGYKDTILHRIIPNCVIQGGIITLTDDDGNHILYEDLFKGQL